MRRLRAWFSRLGGLFNNERRERELADELESHLQMHIEDNLRRDMTPEDRQAAMKTMTDARNARLEKALGKDLAKKVTDAMPQGRGGGRPGGQ